MNAQEALTFQAMTGARVEQALQYAEQQVAQQAAEIEAMKAKIVELEKPKSRRKPADG